MYISDIKIKLYLYSCLKEQKPQPILKRIWEQYIAGDITNIDREIIDLLLRHGIKIRHDDGYLIQINLSIPTTNTNVLVIGLRYKKKDTSLTEDRFLCSSDDSTGKLVINQYYKGALEGIYPEYKGTHKHQLYNNWFDVKDNPITQVNTISYLLNKK